MRWRIGGGGDEAEEARWRIGGGRDLGGGGEAEEARRRRRDGMGEGAHTRETDEGRYGVVRAACEVTSWFQHRVRLSTRRVQRAEENCTSISARWTERSRRGAGTGARGRGAHTTKCLTCFMYDRTNFAAFVAFGWDGSGCVVVTGWAIGWAKRGMRGMRGMRLKRLKRVKRVKRV